MTDKELKLAIQKTIIDFGTVPVHQAAISLFKTLGYNTERQNPLTHKSYDDFKDSFLDTDSPFNEEKAYVKEWKSIDLLFQLTADEVSNQKSLFDTKQVDNTIIETYLFFSVELAKAEYNRTQLAQITREINKVFPMPVLIVFKHGDSITLSVINRRLNKKDAQKDVLEKVTVIKDISTTAPHRAHIEILFDLSFSELLRVHKFTNFVELHNAWQKTLDTKELNKRFYRDLSNWYFWALQEVHFPTTNWAADKNSLLKEDEKVKEHNAKNLIRLLTRLLFVWFVKEKNLVPDELFDETYIKDNLLNGFEPRKKKGFDYKTLGSKYYRAILQNLFFATLNQTVGKREFRKDGQQMNVTNLMRYESYFKDPQAFIKLVEDIVPFMNGGLFECLDSPDPVLKGKKGGDVIIYEDGFSDRKDNTLCVPDYIFFGTGEQADLSVELGDKKQKDVTVNGLINILKSYKFTVTENTPIEEDIALDPELLGRVFENLLASYNPETKTTARKQTGSFYTPREIVNYMVDESLKAYLKQKLETEAGMKPEDAEVGLEFLVGYNEKMHLFDHKQTAVLINAIDNCKILDPACGSGAFPMGILHKLVHILHKLDPNNELWKERQIEKAETIDDFEIRDKLIEDIKTSFESNELDYGRKLYLIENCIYGVDIQPIATQISKLRFFISLIVDQKTDKSKDNFGIRPLPNLETKFVAANTLIGIDKPDGFLRNIELDNIEVKLKDIRHRLFSAKTPKTKRELREKDQLIREEMGKILEDAGWSNESARQLATWDPYNQNVSSEWFDPEWMFGIENGFDVVIGNPPYVQIKQIPWDDRRFFENKYKSATGRFNLFYLFLEISAQLANNGGFSVYIVPDRIMLNTQCNNLRKWLINKQTLIELDSFDDSVFDSAVVDSVIIIYQNIQTNYMMVKAKDRVNILSIHNTKYKQIPVEYFNNSPSNQFDLSYDINVVNVMNKIRSNSKNLSSIADVKDGIIQGKVADKLFLKNPIDNKSKKLLFGEDINRFKIRFNNNWVNYKPNEMMKIEVKRRGPGVRHGLWLRNPEIFERDKILTRQTADEIIAAFDNNNYYYSNTLHGTSITDDNYSSEYLLSILNSKLITWYYRSTTAEEGKVFAQIKIELLKLIPIRTIDKQKQGLFNRIVNYIQNSYDSFVFNYLIAINDCMVYELYFPEEIKSANAEILKYLTNIPEIKEDWLDDKKQKTIEKVYKELSNPEHPVSIAMEKMKTVTEVRIIEGFDK